MTTTKIFVNSDEDGQRLDRLQKLISHHPEFELCFNTKAGQILNRSLIFKRISDVFMMVGIPANIKGYTYLREAVVQVVSNPDTINRITKDLYPVIADHYKTTPSKVERAIRHAIEVGWSRGRIESLNNYFGVKVYNGHDRPTNGEFIAILADKMYLDGNV
jgi:two-component system response regulator (stage 0 sporulation protein A)